MTDTTISVRIDRNLRERMRAMEEINWSAILRKALINQLNEKEVNGINENNFDFQKAKKASDDMERIRKSGVFNKGKTGVEIIREWRNKRKF